MGIDCKELNKEKLDDILNKEYLLSNGLENAIVYNYDSVVVEKTNNLKLEKDNIMEARFFSDEKEILAVLSDDIKIFEITNQDEEFVISEERPINNKKYKGLKVKKYFEADNDGQVHLKYLKPCNLIER